MSDSFEHIKPFKELTDPEKIDRLHILHKSLLQENKTLKKKVRKLEKHDHKDGRIVVPLEE